MEKKPPFPQPLRFVWSNPADYAVEESL
jgi:hypothetical protein